MSQAYTVAADSRKPLFDPLKFGAIEAPHRVWMAPLTRNRAQADGTPSELAATYYKQRASAGLIITEATQISQLGKGYKDTPGIHDKSHVSGWRHITDTVHEADGRIFLQIWHVGRISHVSLLPSGESPLAPSAITANSQTFTANGFEAVSAPRAMTDKDIVNTMAEYATAAQFAVDAGFDGVELHAANGYLIDQFLRDGANKRDDGYGGSPENRIRFLNEVLDTITEIVGADRTGVRISPLAKVNDLSDSDPETLFSKAIESMNTRGLAYLHAVEQFPGEEQTREEAKILGRLRALWKGVYVANGGFDAETGAARIAAGDADAIAYGRPFISNPDLPLRYAKGAELNELNPDTLYGGGADGYTDYPALAE